MTNKEFAKTNTKFKDACKKAKVDPTPRQASKYKHGRGKACKG